ncbi:hypothetical protein NFI96_021724 [Prochilodus magdalenae]|nr:hypothetical protein NFI96_021724 [Prochilodus magdalenae]
MPVCACCLHARHNAGLSPQCAESPEHTGARLRDKMSATHVLKHTQAAAAATASDQNAQTTFPIGHFGKEQIRIIGGPANHCMARAGSPSPHPSSSPVNSEEDDGGGGARVRKKRKKKDKKDTRDWQQVERVSDIRPKKKKEQKEGKELLQKKPRLPKEVKETKEKEGKPVKETKKVKKDQEVKSKAQAKAATSLPRQRGRKPKSAQDPCVGGAAASQPYITQRSAERGTQWCKAPPLDSRAVETCPLESPITLLHLDESGFGGCQENGTGLTALCRFGDGPFLFQHDRTPVHRASSIETWRSESGVEELDWPAQSPDLHLIEHLWDGLEWRLEQGAVPPEKRKKGKRKNEALQEAAESDDTASLCTLATGGEESTDPMDNTKRRSGRQVKRRKYNEDLDFKVVDDDGETIAVLGTGRIPNISSSVLAWQAEEPPEDDANIIEKILSVRTVKKETSPGEPPEELEEFYVKYRNFSYLHCKWATLEELEKDPRIHQKIKRFRNKQAQMKHIFTETGAPSSVLTVSGYVLCVCVCMYVSFLESGFEYDVLPCRLEYSVSFLTNKNTSLTLIISVSQPDEDLFNPDYTEVDRVLEIAVTTDTETGEEVTHYLVKWCSLSYEESTWELQEDVDPVKIHEFEDLKKIPEHKHVWSTVFLCKERPLPEQWQKLEKSREYRNGNQLREYQLEGMNWLLFNWYNRKNCILADEMGLGKTIQSITFLYEIFLMGLRGPFLIIAPLSTITNWEREFRTWTEINVIVYHGSQISRQMILQYEMYHRDDQRSQFSLTSTTTLPMNPVVIMLYECIRKAGNIVPGQFKFHGVITTFEMIMADCPELKKINWRCVVIDEAHRLKNRNCKLLEGLKLMNLEHKVLLTGTPLQNSVEELFSLLNFLEPMQFPSESTFLEEFGDLKTEEQDKCYTWILVCRDNVLLHPNVMVCAGVSGSDTAVLLDTSVPLLDCESSTHQPNYSANSVLWAASCGQRPVGRVLWAASCGQAPVGRLLWVVSCGPRPVGRVLWAASCGPRPVGSVLWVVSCGQRPVGRVLWAVSCGQRPVGQRPATTDVKKLQAILKPMMLRRLKDDVEKNLAPKEETIIEVELTNIQKKYYRAILEKNFTFLAKGANQHNMPNLINTMMELRKCCNHPYLITGAEEKILESFRKTHNPDAPDFQLQAMIQAAGKLVLIDKLLPKLIAGGHKVLIFSQMVRCLDILEDYLIQRRYTYERIDGRVRGNLRQAAIDRFCKVDSDRFVFLLCTRAGGLGINLTAADTCIIFDSDWNPQNDLQAQARCHRIGQSKAVKVYRLITRNSYEREMFDKASLKLGLDKAVLQDINRKGSLNGVQQLSKMEVEDLLRKGAYGALMDEEDEGSKFCEEDIDQILQRRTQTITIQSEGKGSTFAKASFVSSGNRTDISLDDPNFWQKWAKIAELEIDSKAEKESLVIDTPRVRKQTRHYNSFEDDELMEFSELDSDSEERPCRSRRFAERSRRYLRAECFRVEKNLLIFGWGRWKDILNHGRFKWHLTERDMEVLCRALLAYCVRHYKGDDKIKSFIWDLITPTKDGHNQALQNHSGLSAPVPRGRKGKKMKNQLSPPELKNADWLVHCNPEVVLQDDSYKKHLKQHCNNISIMYVQVLLRVRMLYYLKAEVLGEAASQALEGVPSSKLEVALPDIDYIEIPTSWWDADADKSLLIGVHKHGYERYNAMRADPQLCFLERVGMPDVTALTAEQGAEGVTDAPDSVSKSDDIKEDADVKPDDMEDKEDKEEKEEKEERKEEGSPYPEDTVKQDSAVGVVSAVVGEAGRLFISRFVDSLPDGQTQEVVEQGRALWPAGSALTARLRRLITAYQRYTRREPLRHEFLMHEGIGPVAWQLGEEIRRCTTDPDPLFLEWQRRTPTGPPQSRWTRREQADFYRTVSSFGVVYDPDKKAFDWSQFRVFARLERKTDESLERYFWSFVSMCRTACRLPPRKDEGPVDPTIFVEPVTEERAARTLYRIELLRKVREQVLRHPLLGDRLKLCRPSLYLPVWWECGKHDRDLLIGVAKHGLSRTDFYILNDSNLSFLEAHRNYVHKENYGYPVSGLPHQHCCLYDTSLGHCHSPQPPEYHPPALHPSQTQHHMHAHGPSEAAAASETGSAREGFLDCPPLDDSLELGSLQHEALTADSLHSKTGKEAFNGFPFNSASAGQSMLNSYGVQGELGGAQGDMADSIAGKLRSDVLVGEQGSSEETGLMAPSVELNELQTPWESSDHAEPSDIFNEADPILGTPALETGFLDPSQNDDGQERDDPLTDCLSMPSSDSQSNPVEPLASSFMLFKEIGEGSVEQPDLAASPPEYVPPQPLALSDVSMDQAEPISEELEEKLSDTHSDPSPEGAAEPVEYQFEKEDPCQTSDSPLTKEDLSSAEPSMESLKSECKVPFEDSSEEHLKDPCEVSLEEPCEKLLMDSGKVSLEEPYSMPCKEALGESFEDSPSQDSPEEQTEKESSEEPGKEPLEPMAEDTPDDTTLSAEEPLPSSFPLSPTLSTPALENHTFPDPDVVPHIKQEFLLGPGGAEVKPEPDSTTLTPHLDQTTALEVKDEIKEEETKSPALLGDGFVDAPRFAPPGCEVADNLHDVREPTIAQLLQEKALYSFSEWPKDRVIINRIDSICHAVLKGKWPSSSQQYESPSSVANTCTANSAQQRAGFLPSRMPLPQSLNFSIPHSVPRIQKERLVTPAFLPELKRPRRGFEFEAEVLAKSSHLGEKLQVGVTHRGSTLLLNGWQEAAMDLSKPAELAVGGEAGPMGHIAHAVQSATHKIPGLGSMGLDMAGILQAGLIHPVTGQIVNGSLRRDDSIIRRRRGRRRNVEDSDLGFMKAQGLHLPEQQGRTEGINHAIVSSTSSQPERTTAAPPAPPTEPLSTSVDREAASKSLTEWLRQNPSYSMELPAFQPSQAAGIMHSFIERPKQRRHRCKDPTKLDVNSLTGEERVPVVHRSTGRRLGGAMAPAIKELSRWLDANSEYSVAPDWADVVKHSGFLPEGKFTRILTEPVNRDSGARRRGRRPRSEMPKAPELPAGMGPLFMNGGLIGSMDLVSLPNLRNVPGIPITSLMGFPHGFAAAVSGEDAKNSLGMLPMMLHSMPAVQPPMYSAHMSRMMNQPSSTAASTTSAAGSSSATSTVSSTSSAHVALTPSPVDSSSAAASLERASPESSTDRQSADGRPQGEDERSAATIAAPTSTSSSASIASTGSHLAFNPFLIPGMSHGLLYPHMFLPHGSIMALPAMPAADSTNSPKRKRKKAKDEGGAEGGGGATQVEAGETKGLRSEQIAESKRLEEALPATETTEVGGHGFREPPAEVKSTDNEREREGEGVTERSAAAAEEKGPGDAP